MRVLLIFSILLLISIIAIEAGRGRGGKRKGSKRRNRNPKKSYGKINWKMINTNVDKYVLLEKNFSLQRLLVTVVEFSSREYKIGKIFPVLA